MAERKSKRWVPKKDSGTHSFRTAGGSVSAHGRREAEAKGQTMPGGGFPIRNKEDLANAKHDVGRAKNPEAARRWINKRAEDLGEPKLGEGKNEKKRGLRDMYKK